MKIEKFDHIGVMVRDLNKAKSFFTDLLGTEFAELGDLTETDTRSCMDTLGIELVGALTPDGTIAKTLRSRGEGVCVISLKVPSVDEAVAEMRSKGMRPIFKVERGGMRAVMFHPADAYGVMIEVVEYESTHPCVVAFHRKAARAGRGRKSK